MRKSNKLILIIRLEIISFANKMETIFDEGDEGKIISVFETTKDIICIRK